MIAFSRALTGLRTAEQNLYVTSNNLSNVETEGYHRQRLNQYSFQSTGRGDYSIGLGVDADSVRQTRLEFLETNYRQELASYGEYKYEDKVFTSLQSIIGDDGSYLQDTLQDLWGSFDELAKEYTTTVAGTYLRENAVSLIAEFNDINEQLDKMQSELDTELRNTVLQINTYSAQIAKLNDEITKYEIDGSLACELRDSRDSIIASLSQLVDVTVENSTNSCVDVRSASGYLVVRSNWNELDTAQITTGSTFYSPVWKNTKEEFIVTGGELKGIIDMRGGDAVGNLINSTNGSPKEKMDIVVSIDTDMGYEGLASMVDNLANMLDTFDRQAVNYELYLTTGKKVTASELTSFVDTLYAVSAKNEITSATATSMTGLQKEISDKYGKDTQLSKDIWEYIDNNTDFNSFKTDLLNDIGTDNDEIISALEKYAGTNISGFYSYVNELGNSSTKTALNDYIGKFLDGESPFSANTLFDKTAINDFIDVKYDITNYSTDVEDANTGNVLWNIVRVANNEYREDSNPYLMVFTDDAVGSDISDIASIMGGIDMHLIALTDEDSKISWQKLAEKTDGTVLDINELSTEDGADATGLTITRDFNTRLIGVEAENGVAYFRSGLNSLLNSLVREINGVLRQGISSNGKQHGQEYIDPETGDTKEYNLDLFIKIDDNLPLQMGNIAINPMYQDVLNMPLSLSGDAGDFRIGGMLVDLTTTDVFGNSDGYSTFDEHYADFILNFGQAANKALNGYEIQGTVLTTAKDRISEVSGVSLDEELSNMIKYQYSYTASSRMINVIDEMLETIISL